MNKKEWNQIEPQLARLNNRTAFDLSAECVVLTAEGDAMETTLNGLSHHLNASSALSSPSMMRYVELAQELGAENAMNTMLEELGDDAEEFCEQWRQAKEDIANGAKASLDDIVSLIKTAKKGFDHWPRKILVVSLGKKGADTWLVSSMTDVNR